MLLIATAVYGQASIATEATLRVTGNVERERTFTERDLRGLAWQRVDDVRELRVEGQAQDGAHTRRYSGVLLRDVIAAAKPVEKERHDLRRSVVVVTARDGYTVVFSWAELFLSPIGAGAMVVLERDGEPLAPNEGPLALVSLRDSQPGPRHVKWLEKIELRRVSD